VAAYREMETQKSELDVDQSCYVTAIFHLTWCVVAVDVANVQLMVLGLLWQQWT